MNLDGSKPPPSVAFRYFAKKQFADDFFETGKLRLTSVLTLRTYADEARGDPHEGSVDVSHDDAHGNSFRIFTVIGHNVLVLCTSARLSSDLARAFKAEACIRIFDIPRFAKAVSSAVPHMISCFGGMCLYTKSLSVNRKTTGDLGGLMRSEDGSLSIGNGPQMNYTTRMVSHDLLFRKRTKFLGQEEFRLAWILGRSTQGHEFVTCPDAREFCDRVEIP